MFAFYGHNAEKNVSCALTKHQPNTKSAPIYILKNLTNTGFHKVWIGDASNHFAAGDTGADIRSRKGWMDLRYIPTLLDDQVVCQQTETMEIGDCDGSATNVGVKIASKCIKFLLEKLFR